MIVYGTKAVHLKTENLKSISCPSCGTQGSLVLSIFRRHAHVFWIPLFPIGKTGVTQCQHCKHVLERKEMPENIKNDYYRIANESKGPIWQFAGLGLIAALFVFGAYSSKEESKREQEYLADPMQGDIYEYKTETGSYSSLKVIEVTEDSIFVSPNDYEISKMSQVYKIDKPENYADFYYGLSREEVNEMYSSGEIYDINR